jgi:hypothetical protein
MRQGCQRQLPQWLGIASGIAGSCYGYVLLVEMAEQLDDPLTSAHSMRLTFSRTICSGSPTITVLGKAGNAVFAEYLVLV